MATQLLFYQDVVPLSLSRHKDLSIEGGNDFSFARATNSVPLLAGEISHAATDYGIVFAGPQDIPVPAAILGTASEENLYIDSEGKWTARYIPAFVRRYPFVFSISEDEKTFTLCVDEAFKGCNRDGRGERLFDDEGKQTQYLQQVVDFQKAYRVEHERTKAFCKALLDLELLDYVQAEFKPAVGQARTLEGVRVVNREKFKKLKTDDVFKLFQQDELEWIYLHLYSLRNLQLLAGKFGDAAAAASAS